MVDEFYVGFKPKSITISKDLFGKVIPFKFRRVKYEILFFNVVSSCDDGTTFEITSSGTEIKQMSGAVSTDNLNFDDFRVSRSGNSMVIGGFAIRPLSLIKAGHLEETLNSLLVWQDIVLSWIEVIDLEPLDGLHDIESWLYSPHVDYFLKQSSSNENLGGGIEISRRDVAPPPIQVSTSEITIKQALKMAELEKVPPLSLTMLVASKKYLNMNKNRQSLLDSATAIEISLSEILRERILSIKPTYRKDLLESSRQIGGLVRALRLTGFDVEDSILSRISTPRNKAIHRGEFVTYEQAKLAFETASVFIRTNATSSKP